MTFIKGCFGLLCFPKQCNYFDALIDKISMTLSQELLYHFTLVLL
jgi:hypothetical protein